MRPAFALGLSVGLAVLIAARLANGVVTQTRPLCVYPQVARWNGSGSQDDAASFSCRLP